MLLEAVIGAVAPTLIGGLFGKKEKKSDQAFNEKQYQLNRRDFYEDRADDRAYVRRRTEAARVADQKIYKRDLKQAQADKANERRYVEKNRAADQGRLNEYADESVATRGVDFQKLRDQAVAAGFNPLSVLGMAGMYSTEKNQQLAGREGIGGAYSGGGGGSSAPSGSFSTVGSSGGYSREFQPALASGGFVAEAVARGVDTIFNSPLGMDMQGVGAQMIKDKAAQDTLAKQVAAQNYRQKFGYDLTSVTSYRPAQAVAPPALPSASAADPKATPAMTDEGTLPAVQDVYMGGKRLPSSKGWTDAAVIEDRFGEVMSNLYGIASSAATAWNAFSTHPNRAGKSKFSRANTFKGDGIAWNGLPAQSNPRKPKLRSATNYAPGGGKTFKIPDWQNYSY